MSDINAFVGHSFNESDEEIVGKFLKYLDRLKKLHPTFSWVNAESAEPKELARKVLTLMEGKNLFIGICTKREIAIAEKSLSSIRFRPGYRKGRVADFEWKTADWIIQEIGLAKGRGMELILLIEEGVRPPGGLQSDIEYITFNRDNLEVAFTKLLEMVSALTPRVAEAPALSQSPKAVTSQAEGESSKFVRPEWTVPKLDWTRDQYELALLQVVISDNDAAVNEIDAAYRATPDASDAVNLVTWEAYTEYLRLAYGKGGNIERLRAIATQNPRSDRILEFLAIVLSRYDEYTQSAKIYQSAANECSGNRKAHLLSHAAAQYALANAIDEATKLVGEIKRAHERTEVGELQVIEAMRRFAEITKDDDSLLVIMERIMELTPDDFEARFALAYRHSQCDNNDLAMHHYLRIPHRERGAGTWNNMGVVLDHFRLRGMAVNAYRKSKEMGETLAMSNLGQKFLSAGFADEAQAECNKAILIKDYHSNVLDILAKLKEMPDEERKNRDDALEKAKPKIEFYRAVGRVVSATEPEALAERWQGPDCILTLQLSGKSVRISGSYERDANPFGLVGGYGLLSIVKQMIKYQIEYTGTLLGRTIVAFVSRTKDGGHPVTTLAESLDNKTKVLMIVRDDHSEIEVLEDPHGVYPKRYVLKRVDANAS